MASNGAGLFPVAKGVNVPFIGKDEGGNFSSHIILQEVENIDTNSIKRIHDFEEGKVKRHKHPRKLAMKDKSKGRIDGKYLKLISSGFSFDDDVVEERTRDSTWHSSIDKSRIFDQVKKPKKARTGLGGRCDIRCGIVKHHPCFLRKDVHQTGETIESIQPKVLPRIQSKMAVDDEFLKTAKQQAVTTIKPQVSWDEYLMTLLSRETAKMVINDFTSGVQQKKLNDSLIKDDAKRFETSSSKPSRVEIDQGDSKRKSDVQALESSEYPNGNDVVNKNKYKKEVIKGAFPIAGLKWGPNSIVLDSDPHIVYGKVLEEAYPPAADNWYDWGSKSKKQISKAHGKVVKGMHKWKDFPELIEDAGFQKMTLHTVPSVQSCIELDSKTVKKQREDANLVRIVQEWRSRWFLEKKWENSSNKELLDGMCDINDHVRLSAVSACSKALLDKKVIDNKVKVQDMTFLSDSTGNKSHVAAWDILEKIIDLLSDRCKEVQVASAITLFALNRATEKANGILLETLTNGGPPEKWAAAQCLAHSGCDADVVVKELFNNINSPDLLKHSKSIKLLSRLSMQSTIVQYTLAEQLNSSSWRDRLVACQIFPSMQGPLSMDIASKISHLMWNDWSKDVRTAAARALGRTGNGKLVHDKLRERLISGNEIEKLDALRKISFLGIMTGRMLPAFLSCLRSDYISIRLEAVMAISAIRLSHEEAVSELLRLAKEERNWKVKAHCIKAIGLVAQATENVQEILLWCLRYEREAAIRAEACQAIRNLKIDTERVVTILQDRVDAEEDSMVQREVALTLSQFGIEPTGDLTMVKAVHEEVKKLCTRDDIADAIVNQDVEERYEKNKQKYLVSNDEESAAKDASNSNKSNQSADGYKQLKFDPILEGYKIQQQPKVSIPTLPVVPESVIHFDAKSGSDASSEYNTD